MGILFFAFDAYAAPKVKTFGPNCYYEVTRVVEDGVIVSEKQVEVCEEETEQGKQKMDPVVKKEMSRLAMYTLFIAVVSKLD
tara:strand:+ start:1238 stop:1483 length:246 start_codon:yes stop_codon:yes gene_type:complete